MKDNKTIAKKLLTIEENLLHSMGDAAERNKGLGKGLLAGGLAMAAFSDPETAQHVKDAAGGIWDNLKGAADNVSGEHHGGLSDITHGDSSGNSGSHFGQTGNNHPKIDFNSFNSTADIEQAIKSGKISDGQLIDAYNKGELPIGVKNNIARYLDSKDYGGKITDTSLFDTKNNVDGTTRIDIDQREVLPTIGKGLGYAAGTAAGLGVAGAGLKALLNRRK